MHNNNNNMRMLNDGMRARVRLGRWLNIRTVGCYHGLRHGCDLPPLPFNVCFAPVFSRGFRSEHGYPTTDLVHLDDAPKNVNGSPTEETRVERV